MKHLTGRERLLAIFFRLTNGEQINPQQLASDYQCTERSIQRDLKLIRERLKKGPLPPETTRHTTPKLVLVPDSQDITYQLEHPNFYTRAEAFALAKLLLSSRAFTKEELTHLMTRLFSQLDQHTQKALHELIKSEAYHYQQVSHHQPILDSLETFIDYITKKQTLNARYLSPYYPTPLKVNGLPLSLMFSENYFYVRMFTKDSNQLRTLRLDRFQDITLANNNLTVPHAKKTEDGIIRKKSLYMFSSGSDFGFSFRYWGAPEIVQDKFPEAVITYPKNQDYIDVMARSYEDGAIFWLLSQGEKAQVTHPLSLVTKMKNKITEMAKLYQS